MNLYKKYSNLGFMFSRFDGKWLNRRIKYLCTIGNVQQLSSLMINSYRDSANITYQSFMRYIHIYYDDQVNFDVFKLSLGSFMYQQKELFQDKEVIDEDDAVKYEAFQARTVLFC